MIVTMLTAIPLGIFSAIRHNRWSDYLIRFLSFIGNSAPNFFAALILMYVFSVKLGWLPVITSENIAASLVLPTLTLAIAMAAKYIRQIRAAVLEELKRICDGSQGQRCQRKCDYLEKCSGGRPC